MNRPVNYDFNERERDSSAERSLREDVIEPTLESLDNKPNRSNHTALPIESGQLPK